MASLLLVAMPFVSSSFLFLNTTGLLVGIVHLNSDPSNYVVYVHVAKSGYKWDAAGPTQRDMYDKHIIECSHLCKGQCDDDDDDDDDDQRKSQGVCALLFG